VLRQATAFVSVSGSQSSLAQPERIRLRTAIAMKAFAASNVSVVCKAKCACCAAEIKST
jgi:hypothetical protein